MATFGNVNFNTLSLPAIDQAGQRSQNAKQSRNFLANREGRAQAAESRAEQTFDTNTQMENTKIAYRAFSEMGQDPAALQRWVPVLKERGIVRPEFDPSTQPTDQLMATAQQRAEEYGEILRNEASIQQKPRTSKLLTPEELQQKEHLAGVEARINADSARELALGKLTDKSDLEITTQQPAALSKVEAAGDKTGMLTDLIKEAKGQATFWTTGLVGQKLSGIGGTPAHDLQSNLTTIKSNLGFDRLQEMRDNSKTGGALGSISEQEGRKLEAVWGSLEQSQSKGQFVKNLARVEAQVKRSNARIKAVYKAKYGSAVPTTDAGKRDYALVQALDIPAEVGTQGQNNDLSTMSDEDLMRQLNE